MKFATLVVAMLIACSYDAAAQTPFINNVVSQASSAPPVSPGMPVLVVGSNLAGGSTACAGTQVPLSCGSVSVTFNNRAVPVRWVTPNQVWTYVPVDQSPGTVSVVLRNHLGVSSAAFVATVEQYAPGIQKLDVDGSVLGFFSDSSQRMISRAYPASPGRELTMYAIGLGPTAPQVPTGQVGSAPVVTMPTLWIGNRSVAILSAALGCGVLCEPGNYLLRFVVPADIPNGDQPVSVEIGGKRSAAVTLVVGPGTGGPVVGYLQSAMDARVRTLAPGMVAQLVGGGFTASPGGVGPCSMDPSYWATTCQGVTVTINDRKAAILNVSSSFIMLQIPFEVNPGPATLVVERVADSQTLKSGPFSFTLEALRPTIPANPQSRYAGVYIQNSGGVASATNPLLPGDTIFVYADGLGQTNPPLVTGFSLLQPAATVLRPSITICGKALENVSAMVLPGMIGQYRVSATVPTGLGIGDFPIVLEIGGKRSQDGLLVPVANAPVIAAVVNAASGTPDIVSGSWVTLYGRNLSATRRTWNEKDIVYDWLPTALDGVVVAFNDVPAVISYVSPMQLNVLVPDDLPAGRVDVTVQSSLGWQKGSANVKAYAPGLFVLPAPPGNYVMALHADWSYVSRPGFPIGGQPAKPGETIVFYGTGFGKTDPPVPTKHRFSGSAELANPVRVQIGPASATVAYIGLVSNGLYQMNVVIPESLNDGDHEVIVTMGTETSMRGRLLPVAR